MDYLTAEEITGRDPAWVGARTAERRVWSWRQAGWQYTREGDRSLYGLACNTYRVRALPRATLRAFRSGYRAAEANLLEPAEPAEI